MPRYANTSEVNDAFRGLVGKYDFAYYFHEPEYLAFSTFARFQEGEHVLDLGTGSGRVAIAARGAIGDGFCAGVDCVRPLLQVDAKHNIRQAGFQTGKDAPAASSIRLCVGDIGDPDFRTHLYAALSLPPAFRFNVITALWVFDLLPMESRVSALRRWSRMLGHNGRIVLHISLLADGTECPASYTTARPGPSVTLPDGSTVRKWIVSQQTKIAPPNMWTVCRDQVSRLAQHCGLRVVSIQDSASGNDNHGGTYKDLSNQAAVRFRTEWEEKHPGVDYKLVDNVQWLQRLTGVIMQTARHTGEDVQWKNVAVFATLQRV